MTSQWQLEIDDEGRQTEASCGFAARIAAAIAILAAVTFVDATPQMSLGSAPPEHGACRANQCHRHAEPKQWHERSAKCLEYVRPTRPNTREALGKTKGHACVAFVVRELRRLLQMLADVLGELEHRRLSLAEQRAQLLVRIDHAAIGLVLQVVLLDVFPDLTRDFGARHRH